MIFLSQANDELKRQNRTVLKKKHREYTSHRQKLE